MIAGHSKHEFINRIIDKSIDMSCLTSLRFYNRSTCKRFFEICKVRNPLFYFKYDVNLLKYYIYIKISEEVRLF